MGLIMNFTVNSVQANADGSFNVSLSAPTPTTPIIHASMTLLLDATAKTFVATLTPGEVIPVTL